MYGVGRGAVLPDHTVDQFQFRWDARRCDASLERMYVAAQHSPQGALQCALQCQQGLDNAASIGFLRLALTLMGAGGHEPELRYPVLCQLATSCMKEGRLREALRTLELLHQDQGQWAHRTAHVRLMAFCVEFLGDVPRARDLWIHHFSPQDPRVQRHLLRMRSFDALTHQCSYDEVEECVGEIADLFDMRTNCGRLLCGVSACCCPVRNPWGQVALAEYTEGLARCLFNNGRLMDLLWQRACWRYQVALHGGADVLLSPCSLAALARDDATFKDRVDLLRMACSDFVALARICVRRAFRGKPVIFSVHRVCQLHALFLSSIIQLSLLEQENETRTFPTADPKFTVHFALAGWTLVRKMCSEIQELDPMLCSVLHFFRFTVSEAFLFGTCFRTRLHACAMCWSEEHRIVGSHVAPAALLDKLLRMADGARWTGTVRVQLPLLCQRCDGITLSRLEQAFLHSFVYPALEVKTLCDVVGILLLCARP